MLFLAITAHCHDRAAIKIHNTHFTRIFFLFSFFFFLFSFFLFLIHASYKREFTLSISVNSQFRLYRKFPHLSITNSVTRQGGSINIIQVTVYSFTVPALKLMKVK